MAVFEKVQEINVEELGKEPSVTLTTSEDLEEIHWFVPSYSEIEDAFWHSNRNWRSDHVPPVGDLVAYVEEKQKIMMDESIERYSS